MSVGLIKSGGYVPCGASATLMSQYPMKPATDWITLTQTQLRGGWTAPCAGVLDITEFNNPTGGLTYSCDGITIGRSAGNVANAIHSEIMLNKGSVFAITLDGTVSLERAVFRPFAVGEVL